MRFLIYPHGILLLSFFFFCSPQQPWQKLPMGEEMITPFPSTAHANAGNDQPFQHSGRLPISAYASPGQNQV